MQKNEKVLLVIPINKDFSLDREQFDIIKRFDKIVFINTTGIFAKDIQVDVEKSFMDFGYDPSHVKNMFFVHMNRLVFGKLEADTEEKKIDFSIWHFFYDIFKVPKYNFMREEYQIIAAMPPKSLIKLDDLLIDYEKEKNKYLFVDNKNIHSGCIFDRQAFEKMQIESFEQLEKTVK